MGMNDHEGIQWLVHARVDKYNGLIPELRNLTGEELARAGISPSEVVEWEGNLLTLVGAQRILDCLIGAATTTQMFNATNARIGVGDNATAAANTDTNLGVGGANRYWQLVTSVTRTTQSVAFVATFTGGTGNYAWAEWGLDNGSASSATATAPLLNRKVASLGTKTSAASWAFTVTISIA